LAISGWGPGCEDLDQVEGAALRRRAIVAILALRLTGRRGAIASYYLRALEAALTDNEVDRICTALGHPRYCPGGKPIPMGACCLARVIAKAR